MKNYPDLDRGQWAELKLSEVLHKLPNTIVSDIGSGFGWFKPIIKKFDLKWQPFDYVKKIEESTIWDLNSPVPDNMARPGFVIFLEVLEHLSNPELGIRNISNHIENGGYMVLTTPNPFSAHSKFTMVFKNTLYAFQTKHLIEHHVFVPLPHVVQFHLENNGFEILEAATIGKLNNPVFKFNINFIKSVVRFMILKLFVLIKPESKGHTQAFFVIKK
ncbi:MAG: methyltransferase domain-containing protein [Bacteroidota bacterium]